MTILFKELYEVLIGNSNSKPSKSFMIWANGLVVELGSWSKLLCNKEETNGYCSTENTICNSYYAWNTVLSPSQGHFCIRYIFSWLFSLQTTSQHKLFIHKYTYIVLCDFVGRVIFSAFGSRRYFISLYPSRFLSGVLWFLEGLSFPFLQPIYWESGGTSGYLGFCFLFWEVFKHLIHVVQMQKVAQVLLDLNGKLAFTNCEMLSCM